MLVENSPHEVWSGKNPSVAYLRCFWCDAFVHVPKEKRSKMDNKEENNVSSSVTKME